MPLLVACTEYNLLAYCKAIITADLIGLDPETDQNWDIVNPGMKRSHKVIMF